MRLLDLFGRRKMRLGRFCPSGADGHVEGWCCFGAVCAGLLRLTMCGRADRLAGGGRKGRFPRCGKMGSMVWKNGKNGFHGVEVFPKLASMAWKNGENDFHGVEVPQSDDSPRGAGGQGGQIRVPWRGSFEKSGFHGVEKRHNLGSMAWKNGEFDFHGVEVFASRQLMAKGG